MEDLGHVIKEGNCIVGKLRYYLQAYNLSSSKIIRKNNILFLVTVIGYKCIDICSPFNLGRHCRCKSRADFTYGRSFHANLFIVYGRHAEKLI